MNISYNGYLHDPAECEIEQITSIARNPDGGVDYKTVTTTITGKIYTVLGDIDAKIRAMMLAYSVDGGNFICALPNGQDTVHSIYDSQTMDGVRVVQPPSFPVGGGAEYSSFRTYQIVLEARFQVANSPEVISFTETVTYRGGGPRVILIETINGPPVRQVTNQMSVATCIQSGQIVTSTRYSSIIPPPIYPQFIIPTETEISRTSPTVIRKSRGGYFRQAFVTTYGYVMQSGGFVSLADPSDLSTFG